MQGFAPGLLDKLFSNGAQRKTALETSVTRLTMDELKDSVARDLESLLNTRKVISDDVFKQYPECEKSIASYGLNDFAGLSLASTEDRVFICRSLEQAIIRHEPRLKNVRATLEVEESSINKLRFAISALLVVHPSSEPVSFDAVLKPSSLHYSISKARRATGLSSRNG